MMTVPLDHLKMILIHYLTNNQSKIFRIETSIETYRGFFMTKIRNYKYSWTKIPCLS